LALTDIDPEDARIPRLVTYLESCRDRQRFSWGTTAENAHALLAMGAYLSHRPVKPAGKPHVRYSTKNGGIVSAGSGLGDRERDEFWATSVCVENDGKASAFLSWRKVEWPSAASVTNASNGLFISRRYLRANGEPADMANLVRGEMLVAELTVTSDVSRVVGDLVIEDLFAGAFEPVHRELDSGIAVTPSGLAQVGDWIMRKDARDDRMLVFSKRFELKRDHEAKAYYPVRVVSAGDFVLPGPSVEGMYSPELRSVCATSRIVVK